MRIREEKNCVGFAIRFQLPTVMKAATRSIIIANTPLSASSPVDYREWCKPTRNTGYKLNPERRLHLFQLGQEIQVVKTQTSLVSNSGRTSFSAKSGFFIQAIECTMHTETHVDAPRLPSALPASNWNSRRRSWIAAQTSWRELAACNPPWQRARSASATGQILISPSQRGTQRAGLHSF